MSQRERETVLVTGGTGFIGSHVVERLREDGWGVRLLVRQRRWRWGPAPSGLEWVLLDLTVPTCAAALKTAMEGVAAVVHLAGALATPRISQAQLRALHVEGTRRLLDAAREHTASRRPLRFVHVSTTGVLGPTASAPLDEHARPNPTTAYERTKWQGEGLALAANETDLEVVVIRPGLVYGPRDLHLLPLFRAIDRGFFRAIAGGEALWQPIHVLDVARALGQAVRIPGLGGKCFHIAGSATISVRGLAEAIASRLGKPQRVGGLPWSLAWSAGAILEAASVPLSFDPPLTRARVRTLTESRLYDSGRAAREMGFRPTVPLNDGLRETVQWYREHGYL